MSGLSPLTMWQANSRQLMIEQNRTGTDHKFPKPKMLSKNDSTRPRGKTTRALYLESLSASFTKFSSFVKDRTRSKKSKKAKNFTAVVGKKDLDSPERQVRLTSQPVEASASTVAHEMSAMPQCTNLTGTTATRGYDSNKSQQNKLHDIAESPFGLSTPTGDVSPPSSSTSNSTTIASIPIEILRNIIDDLHPMDLICLGLAKQAFWEAVKEHLQVVRLYPARFIITDAWGRYNARPSVYWHLPERLETWMSPRVLFHESSPRMFVENQVRVNYLKIYFRMCERRLSTPTAPLRCLDRLEYKRPIWVLPDCPEYFEQWRHLGVHDEEHCIICKSLRAMIRTRSQEALALGRRAVLLRSIVRIINSHFH